MEEDELLKCCYEWQIGNFKCGSWAVSPRDELYKTGLQYILLYRGGMDLKDMCQIMKTRGSDIQRQSSRK
jgi:hypothetical protein